MKEIWKDIEGYEGLYQVSNLGRVRSSCALHARSDEGRANTSGWRLMNPGVNSSGYPLVHLSVNGRVTTRGVHRLVAEAFVENPDNPYCPQLSYNNNGSTSTILTLTNPAQGDGYFYIPIPAGTYNSLSIYLTTYENSYANATLGDGSPITISQNAIFPFTIDNLSFSGSEK